MTLLQRVVGVKGRAHWTRVGPGPAPAHFVAHKWANLRCAWVKAISIAINCRKIFDPNSKDGVLQNRYNYSVIEEEKKLYCILYPVNLILEFGNALQPNRAEKRPKLY